MHQNKSVNNHDSGWSSWRLYCRTCTAICSRYQMDTARSDVFTVSRYLFFILFLIFEFQLSPYIFTGDLFLRMLKCLIVPLLTSSIISAIGSLDLKLSKRIAFRSISLYATTTICAVILGIILVLTIRPGVGKDIPLPTEHVQKSARNVLTVDTLMDLVR